LFRKSCLDLLNKIKSLDTRTPVILTSGHDNAERYIEKSRPPDIMLLSKPIEYSELKRLIDTSEVSRNAGDRPAAILRS
jgi:DNA-binding NtrC family response regulator